MGCMSRYLPTFAHAEWNPPDTAVFTSEEDFPSQTPNETIPISVGEAGAAV